MDSSAGVLEFQLISLQVVCCSFASLMTPPVSNWVWDRNRLDVLLNINMTFHHLISVRLSITVSQSWLWGETKTVLTLEKLGWEIRLELFYFFFTWIHDCAISPQRRPFSLLPSFIYTEQKRHPTVTLDNQPAFCKRFSEYCVTFYKRVEQHFLNKWTTNGKNHLISTCSEVAPEPCCLPSFKTFSADFLCVSC